MKPNDPSTNGTGRNSDGTFASGNRAASNRAPRFAAQVTKLRKALLDEISSNDGEHIRAVARAMIAKAVKGNVAAARLVLEYSLGKPIETDLFERLEELEELATQNANRESWRC